MATHHDCVPISLDPNYIYYATQPQLVKANRESIRLDFSRNLVEDLIADLPTHIKFPISSAWNHTSGEGLKNVRLNILIGTDADNFELCFLDVTTDTWAKIKNNFYQRPMQEGN